MAKPRIVLLHATPVAMAPVHAAFAQDWPEAETVNLLDDGLTIDRAKEADTLSAKLIARYVAPRFQELNVNRQASMDWVKGNKAEFTGQMQAAVGARIVQHMMEKGADNIRPEIVEMIKGQAAGNAPAE